MHIVVAKSSLKEAVVGKSEQKTHFENWDTELEYASNRIAEYMLNHQSKIAKHLTEHQ